MGALEARIHGQRKARKTRRTNKDERSKIVHGWEVERQEAWLPRDCISVRKKGEQREVKCEWDGTSAPDGAMCERGEEIGSLCTEERSGCRSSQQPKRLVEFRDSLRNPAQ